MPQPITATQLRANVYRILDHVLETGETLEVMRGGSKLLIVPAAVHETRRLKDRPKRDGLNCTIEELVATSWEKEWRPDP